jgi:hypothetical protein
MIVSCHAVYRWARFDAKPLTLTVVTTFVTKALTVIFGRLLVFSIPFTSTATILHPFSGLGRSYDYLLAANLAEYRGVLPRRWQTLHAP